MKYARIRPDRHRCYHPIYHRKWFRVHDPHPDPTTAKYETHEGYVWVETPGKIMSMRAEDLEISDRATD